jgi:exodeoxyribonuclease V alpha subunit
MGKKILLGAPTGRAARRLSDVTQRKAETIHKLLGYNLSTEIFDKDRDDPLEADAVIIDEASMMDTMLMFHLLKAVPMSSMLILVGDIFQLPSVGPGNVLSDMIKSGRIETFELTQIFRQVHESPIVANAHRIRRGEFPELTPYEKSGVTSGFFFIEQSRPDEVVKTITQLCRHHLPDQLAINPVNEIQVITPMHKGAVGTLNLNQVLQKVMNPVHGVSRSGKGRFRINDKVMHLKNNYQKEVFNGDIGIIHDVDGEKRKVYVNFDERIVDYDQEELDELSLAYAISVHKSQGSEYPVVLIPLLTQHFVLLQRNLLYTAITRGRHLVIIIGTRKALEIALKNDKPLQRMSSLAAKII